MPKSPEPPTRNQRPATAAPSGERRPKPHAGQELELDLALEGLVRWGDEVLLVP